ncbi:hypothetical protein C4579_02115 [Candidatus Microgenomates bacterium]|nr:MAG: hypothetical protein C4579_02115 [Candidatus Microgenomates bacterium]
MYHEINADDFSMVDHFNDYFGTDSWTPIESIEGNLPVEEIRAQMGAADVAVMVAENDGFNLMIPESAATNQKGCVVIAGEDTGAAHLLNASDDVGDRGLLRAQQDPKGILAEAGIAVAV